MPDKCSVVGCKGNYRHGPRVHVFSFPKEEELKRKWIAALKRKDFVPTKNTKVCERHFRKSEIVNKVTAIDPRTGKKFSTPLRCFRLSSDAVPSLHMLPKVKLSTKKCKQKRVGRNKKKLNNDALQEILSRSCQQINFNPENNMLNDDASLDLPLFASLEWDSDDNRCPQNESDDNDDHDNQSASDEISIGAFFIWRPESTRMLIEHFKFNEGLFKYGYMGKKDEWAKIAQAMQDNGFPVTGDLCEEKWDSLFSIYKDCVEKNRTISCSDKWEYFEQFQELYWSEITSILDSQTKGMLNVGIQTDAKTVYCTSMECEPVCSSTTNSVLSLPTDCSMVSTNEYTQGNNSLETEDSLLELLKEKHQFDSHWQLEMRELVLKNTEAQEQTNKILNRLFELLTSVEQC